MKKLILALLFVGTLSSYSQGVIQNWHFGDVGLFYTTDFYEPVPLGSIAYTESEKIKILEKQYLNSRYQLAKIDEYKTNAHLRYNLYNDQMEFAKDGKIYYLRKEEGRTVQFKDSDFLYKVVKVDDQLKYMKVLKNGEYGLLVQQSKKFIKPKKRRTSYGYIIDPTFRRNNDEIYIKLYNDKVVEAPSRKSDFFELFGSKSEKIKSYMKSNDIGFRKLEDLQQIITYLNSEHGDLQKG